MQADAEAACINTRLTGPKTYVRLPPNRVPAKFKHLRDPAFVLELALYGHPDSGGHWEKFCEDALIKTLGWSKIAQKTWRSVFWHEASKAFLIVYVDDFRLSGPAHAVPKLFEDIGKHIKISKPEISGKLLGCDSKMFQAKYPAGGNPASHIA